MSRSDSYHGLNKVAQKIISTRANAEVRTRPTGSKIVFEQIHNIKPGVEVTVIGAIKGRYLEDDQSVAELHRYRFPSGVVYEEYVQVAPLHHGPCFFIALRRPSGKFLKTTLWDRRETGMSEEMNNFGATSDESNAS